MGVTYKLKDEVIDFIKDHKRENSRISCRSLVVLIEEKFLIKVSKSAINAVIKDANLSSPIGRPSVKAVSSRKFTIPPEKKIQPPSHSVEILKNENNIKEKSKLPFEDKKEDICKPRIENTVQIKKFQEFKIKDVSSGGIKKIPGKSNDKKTISTGESFGDEQYFKIKFKKILMLIIIRDFFSRPALDEFFKRNTSFSEREIAILDVLLCFYPDVFVSPNIALEEENEVVWKILGWKDFPDLNEIEQIIKYLKSIQISTFDFYLEEEYFLTLVNSISFFTEDEKAITMDGRMTSIHAPGDSMIACPIEKSLGEVSNFLSGGEILKLYCPEDCLSDDLLEQIVHICENPQNLRKISLNGMNGRVVSEIKPVNNYGRKFLLNIKDRNKKMVSMKTNSLSEKFSFNNVDIYLEDSSKMVKEVFLHLSGEKKVRTATFYEPGADFLRHCLTNLTPTEMTSSTIFAGFLEIRQYKNFENLKVVVEDNKLSLMNIENPQDNMFSLLDQMLSKMKALFWAYNSLGLGANKVLLSHYEDVVCLVYGKCCGQIKIRIDNNQSIEDQESLMNISRFISECYSRVKIPRC